ncbi:2-succinyl-5-enolpyruvyl-6-hydroxy-3-cyclohexene-1-carboxylic-acid synthase [Agrilactobacillus yilanensis]|uniref:2-succinyl-5-enolpyruvyl-6-hydroxy-3-cyclohexene-1-carboxylate synthase n=1 Tax=Agrilactobacillus yilanensis TaxID=2485997 RepID=A0ABW4JCI2_9LACO|nr:2-succinyl-5-enolpyruvyl-6-hydroxy-3-cyclohexene-1-carboxylic-acid synthase [Agrilactobacillus yilanensis]
MMVTSETLQLTGYVQTIIDSLEQQHLKNIVIAPGSRSTPVALLLAQAAKTNDFKLYVDVDERSAAFFALGLTKTTHTPTLLLCTSGTAAANFYPAIIEAHLTHQPLIILTTDRPPELTNIGAPQAIDQDHLYGAHVKQFLQLPLPTDRQSVLEYVAFSVQRAYLASQQAPKGPVHLNLPLRKPLMPLLGTEKHPIAVEPIQPAPTVTALTPTALTQLQKALKNQRILLVAGPEETADDGQALLALAEKMNWPILTDPLHPLRAVPHPLVLTCGDRLLKATASNLTQLYPDIIIRSGATPVSASLANWLSAFKGPIYNLDPNGTLTDATKATTHQLAITPNWLYQHLALPLAPKQAALTTRWQTLEQAYKTLVAQTLATATLTEAHVPYLMAQHTTGRIFVGNSMPIRDFDDFYQPTQLAPQLYCNRGANGIDGVNSTALGMSAADEKPSYLVIGDLSFFHDMNGLMLAKRYPLNLTIIVIDNNGGGIFSFLPQAQATDYFETLFGTPQDLDLAAVAQLYQAVYVHPKTVAALKMALAAPVKGLRLIEITTERQENLNSHQQFQTAVDRLLEAHFAAKPS